MAAMVRRSNLSASLREQLQTRVEVWYKNIPAQLQSLEQWVLWKAVPKASDPTKYSKIPYTAEGQEADTTDPQTWATFNQVCEVFGLGGYAGIGFVFDEGDPFCGIDLDGGVGETGLHAKHWELLQLFNSYSEYSPSGTGIHIIVRATLPGSGEGLKNKAAGLEIYDRGRYFTFTGDHVSDTPKTINLAQEAVTATYRKYKLTGRVPADPSTNGHAPPLITQSSERTDSEVLQRALGEPGSKAWQVYEGDYSVYSEDRSAADYWLCLKIMGICQSQGQARRIMDTSKLESWHDKSEHYKTTTLLRAYDRVVADLAAGTEDAVQHLTLKELCARVEEIVPGVEGTLIGDSIAYLPKASKDELRRVLKAVKQVEYTTTKALFDRCVSVVKQKVLQAASAGRPIIETDEQLLEVMRAQALTAIHAANRSDPRHPVLYEYLGEPAGVIATAEAGHKIKPLGPSAIQGVLADVAAWAFRGASTVPPAVVANDVFNWGRGFPVIEKVVTYPTFAPNGQLCIEDGYHEKTKLYYAGGLMLGDTEPTPERVAWAKSLILDDLFFDFPFAEQSSRAHAVALLLLPLVLPLIGDVTPMHFIDAPLAGTGKGLLVEVCSSIALGRAASGMATPTDEDEWRKRLSSALLNGSDYMFIDNLPNGQTLDSGALASYLTQYDPSERVLGQSAIVSLHNRAVWVATGNNLAATGEVIRRLVWIRLDANVEHPEERTGFKHEGLCDWVLEHREELLTACVVLCRAWISAGRPLWRERTKGSFDKWATIMGGILQVAGIPGFLENSEQLRQEADSGRSGIHEFIAAWFERYGTAAVNGDDLFPIASHYDDVNVFRENRGVTLGLLDEVLNLPKEASRRKALGRFLNAHKKNVYNGYKIMNLTPSKGKSRYCLVEA